MDEASLYAQTKAFLIALAYTQPRILAMMMPIPIFNRQILPGLLRFSIAAALGALVAPTLMPVVSVGQLDGAQLLLLGAMLIGMLTGESGQAAMQPFSGDLFKGMLAFFLLDMGLLAARNMPKVRGQSPWLIAYAVLGPLVHASLALGLCALLGIGAGDASLLMVLAASASYIAVPAVLRHAIPEANPSLYFGLSLGVTFPFNIALGIPIYYEVARKLYS